ncbi:MAG: cytochrome P450 [Myxococcales bacterium]|nr:cytochrome P450 [Myxococcales bacterium]
MKPPTIGVLSFLAGVRREGFLAFIGSVWREHGDVFQVRIGRKTMLFAMHPDAVAHVSVDNRDNYAKLETYDAVRDYLIGEGLVASNGELWRRQRKLMAPFFTPKSITTYAAVMIRDAETLGERWEGLATEGGEVEIAEEMTLVTASIILQAMFSTQTVEAVRQMKEAVETMVAYANRRMVGFVPPLWVPTPFNQRYKRVRKLVYDTISGLIAERRATPEADWPDDLLSRLMNARDEETGEPMTELLLRDESITICSTSTPRVGA